MSSLPHKISFASSLPNELLVKILADLPAQEMVRCRAVCCQFRDLVDLTPSLQYNLEMFLAGMVSTDVNGSHSTVASAATLQQLRRCRDAWNTFQPTSSRYLQELHHAAPGTNTRFDGRSKEHVSRNILAVTRSDRSIVFFQLSSKPMWGLPQCWEISARSFTPASMVICPEQDLLLLVEPVRSAQNGGAFSAVACTAVRIHILALSTGSPHPLAADPVIFLKNPDLRYYCVKHLSAHGDLLGLMVDIVSPPTVWQPDSLVELWVIEWKTGSMRLNAYYGQQQQQPEVESELATRCRPTTFEFLAGGRVLVSMIEDSAQSTFAALNIYDCESAASERLAFHDIPPVATFRMFELSELSWFQSIDIFCDLAATPIDLARCREHRQDPALRLISLNMQIARFSPSTAPSASRVFNTQDIGSLTLGSFTVFVHAGSLENRCINASDGIVRSWEEWSSDARLFAPSAQGQYYYVRQLRHKRCLMTKGRTPEWLCDFSPAAALRYTSQTADTSGPWEYVMEPEVTESPFLESPVVSALPYRRVRVSPDQSDHEEVRGLVLVEDCMVYSSPESDNWRVQTFY